VAELLLWAKRSMDCLHVYVWVTPESRSRRTELLRFIYSVVGVTSATLRPVFDRHYNSIDPILWLKSAIIAPSIVPDLHLNVLKRL